MYQFVLASESPRRKQLLKEAGFHFTVHPAKLSEIPDKNLNVKDQILAIARQKAEAVLRELSTGLTDNHLILAADTEVVFENSLLGKPTSEENSYALLKRLSGRAHQVVTAMVVINQKTSEVVTHIETSDVKFRDLSDEEIWSYVRTKEGADKAGSYAIQGLGRALVEKYSGSWENIVGLPVQSFIQILKVRDWQIEQTKNSASYLSGFLKVKQQIEEACQRSNRLPSDVTLLAVSKLQPEEKIVDLYQLGHRQFGENYVQEATTKIENLKSHQDIFWHLIGHLQKNKCKYVVGKFNLIHSVDSLDLARALDKECAKKKCTQAVLLQVNIAKEDSKSGFFAEELVKLWPEISELKHLQIEGLMTMPPLYEDPENARSDFRNLKLLLQQLRNNNTKPCHTLKHLSMGTSHDYHIAIGEGATIVRLGTILFGERPTKA